MYFEYGEKETNYLKSKDKRLGEAIEKIGPIKRPVESDLFFSVVDHIVGQQISTSAHVTVRKRMKEGLGQVSLETISAASVEEIQKFGITFRKAEYIKNFAEKVKSGEFDLNALWGKGDDEVIKELTALKGIGPWTAEMIMIFCMQRPDVFSFGDLAIHRGLRMLYGHKEVDRKLFKKYKKRFSPYGTVAGLYIWAIAGGAIEGLQDPKSKN
ncbi:MAG: DNA-3-methyladenine glycosylase 2 family protein [Clostridiales bacterium]|nr:DNA-3-methyladenine glycosylase 2 family protein [Clostridiales bacterium]